MEQWPAWTAPSPPGGWPPWSATSTAPPRTPASPMRSVLLIGDGGYRSAPGCRASASSPRRWGSPGRPSPARTPWCGTPVTPTPARVGHLHLRPRRRGPAHDRALLPQSSDRAAIDLNCAAPFAPPQIATAYAEAVVRLPAYLGGHGYYPAGLPELQAAIAGTYDARGLPTDPEQVMVTPGALSGVVDRGPGPDRRATASRGDARATQLRRARSGAAGARLARPGGPRRLGPRRHRPGCARSRPGWPT